MDRYHGQAAAWAAPLFSYLHAVASDGKLPQLACVLWLPDYGAYLRSLNLFECSFTTSPNADGAMRLGEDQAVAVGRDFIATTGVRVRVRPYHATH